jgi:hypothetical protein
MRAIRDRARELATEARQGMRKVEQNVCGEFSVTI